MLHCKPVFRRIAWLPKSWSDDDEKSFVHRRFLGVITYDRLALLLVYIDFVVLFSPTWYFTLMMEGRPPFAFNYLCAAKLLTPQRSMLVQYLCARDGEAVQTLGETVLRLIEITSLLLIVELQVVLFVINQRWTCMLPYLMVHSAIWCALGSGAMLLTVMALGHHGHMTGVGEFVAVMMSFIVYCLLVAHVNFTYMLDVMEYKRGKEGIMNSQIV